MPMGAVVGKTRSYGVIGSALIALLHEHYSE
jgi:hypothetical protein